MLIESGLRGMKLIENLPNFYTIQLGDKLKHPLFGEMIVRHIYKVGEECEMCCVLLEFNGTVRIFKGLDLFQLKHKGKATLKVMK